MSQVRQVPNQNGRQRRGDADHGNCRLPPSPGLTVPAETDDVAHCHHHRRTLVLSTKITAAGSTRHVKGGQHLGGAQPNQEFAGDAIAPAELFGTVRTHVAGGDRGGGAKQLAGLLR